MMRINEKGLALLKSFEDCRLKAYLCPAGVWTIGWGRTRGVKRGMVITQEQADADLQFDLAIYEKAVEQNVEVALTPNQFSALAMFVYNIGEANFKSSTLLKKLNAGDYQGAADEFPRWNKVKRVVVNGLTRRRAAERDLFLEA